MLVISLVASAEAAEVVWLAPPTEADRARVAQEARATGPALDPKDLRAAATRWTAADEQHLRDVDAALAEARTYETQLDGELLILRDLAGPVAAVTALRDDADRGHLFAALTYQGFAANRYFGADLAKDDDAGPWRAVVNGQAIERPWLDAIALAPTREATPYEIAEAPQRVAYNEERRRVAAALPATLTPRELPPGAELVVDGRVATLEPSGNIKVLPGRHLAHVELEGRILARFDVRVASGEDVPIALPLSDAAWSAFLASVAPGVEVPPEVEALVQALGGEVWLARPPTAPGAAPQVVALDAAGAHAVPLEAPAPPPEGSTPPREAAPLGASVGLLGGWLSSGDFYTQDPLHAPRSVGTVNAVALGGWAEGHVVAGPARFGVGLDLFGTPGTYHLALTGDDAMRFRPLPHAAVGIEQAQVTVGYLLPYHPAAGLRAQLPLGHLLLRASGWWGVPFDRSREDGTTWDAHAVYVLAAGTGARF